MLCEVKTRAEPDHREVVEGEATSFGSFFEEADLDEFLLVEDDLLLELVYGKIVVDLLFFYLGLEVAMALLRRKLLAFVVDVRDISVLEFSKLLIFIVFFALKVLVLLNTHVPYPVAVLALGCSLSRF